MSTPVEIIAGTGAGHRRESVTFTPDMPQSASRSRSRPPDEHGQVANPGRPFREQEVWSCRMPAVGGPGRPRLVILGADFAGFCCARILDRRCGPTDEFTLVYPWAISEQTSTTANVNGASGAAPGTQLGLRPKAAYGGDPGRTSLGA